MKQEALVNLRRRTLPQVWRPQQPHRAARDSWLPVLLKDRAWRWLMSPHDTQFPTGFAGLGTGRQPCARLPFNVTQPDPTVLLRNLPFVRRCRNAVRRGPTAKQESDCFDLEHRSTRLGKNRPIPGQPDCRTAGPPGGQNVC